jgi:hypothetical protein
MWEANSNLLKVFEDDHGRLPKTLQLTKLRIEHEPKYLTLWEADRIFAIGAASEIERQPSDRARQFAYPYSLPHTTATSRYFRIPRGAVEALLEQRAQHGWRLLLTGSGGHFAVDIPSHAFEPTLTEYVDARYAIRSAKNDPHGHAGDVDAVAFDAPAGQVDPARANVFGCRRRVVCRLSDAGDLEGGRLSLLRGGATRKGRDQSDKQAVFPHHIVSQFRIFLQWNNHFKRSEFYWWP